MTQIIKVAWEGYLESEALHRKITSEDLKLGKQIRKYENIILFSSGILKVVYDSDPNSELVIYFKLDREDFGHARQNIGQFSNILVEELKASGGFNMARAYVPLEETTLEKLLFAYFTLRHVRLEGNTDNALKVIREQSKIIGNKAMLVLVEEQLKGFQSGAKVMVSWRMEQAKWLFRQPIPESLKEWLKGIPGLDFSSTSEQPLNNSLEPMLKVWETVKDS